MPLICLLSCICFANYTRRNTNDGGIRGAALACAFVALDMAFQITRFSLTFNQLERDMIPGMAATMSGFVAFNAYFIPRYFGLRRVSKPCS